MSIMLLYFHILHDFYLFDYFVIARTAFYVCDISKAKKTNEFAHHSSICNESDV